MKTQEIKGRYTTGVKREERYITDEEHRIECLEREMNNVHKLIRYEYDRTTDKNSKITMVILFISLCTLLNGLLLWLN